MVLLLEDLRDLCAVWEQVVRLRRRRIVYCGSVVLREVRLLGRRRLFSVVKKRVEEGHYIVISMREADQIERTRQARHGHGHGMKADSLLTHLPYLGILALMPEGDRRSLT